MTEFIRIAFLTELEQLQLDIDSTDILNDLEKINHIANFYILQFYDTSFYDYSYDWMEDVDNCFEKELTPTDLRNELIDVLKMKYKD